MSPEAKRRFAARADRGVRPYKAFVSKKAGLKLHRFRGAEKAPLLRQAKGNKMEILAILILIGIPVWGIFAARAAKKKKGGCGCGCGGCTGCGRKR